MQELKPRLQRVFESVPVNSVVADIGTDHAFLPIALIKNKRAKKVIACDVSLGPLAVAEKNIKLAGVSNIELRLSDGLEAISKGEAQVITIAGMGGDLISAIINKAEWLKECKTKLILQPMSSADSLRENLYKNMFHILSETAVFDSGRVYSVIVAEYSGKAKKLTYAKKHIGKLDKDNSEAATTYIKRQLAKVSECANNLKEVERKRDFYIEMCETKKQIEKILNKRR